MMVRFLVFVLDTTDRCASPLSYACRIQASLNSPVAFDFDSNRSRRNAFQCLRRHGLAQSRRKRAESDPSSHTPSHAQHNLAR